MYTVHRRVGMVLLGVGLLTLGALPALGQELPWLTDYATARREALTKNRPLLLDFGTGTCYWCKKLEQITFRDPAVARMLGDRFVLLRVDGEQQMKLTRMLGVRSYPTLVFAAADGRILKSHEGFITANDLTPLLLQTLAASGRRGPEREAEVLAGMRPAVPPTGPGPAPAGAVMPVSAVGPSPERVQAARALLARAQDDFLKQQYVVCLEGCRALAMGFGDLSEGVEARQLAERIKGNPEVALRTCADLSDRLGELYLGLADGLVRQGRPREAVPYLERILLVCPGSPHGEAARSYLARLQYNAPAVPGSATGP